MLRKALTTAAATLLVALMPGSALAATTIGEADISGDPQMANGDNSLVRVKDSAGLGFAGSPVAGVLTSVTIRATGDAGNGLIRLLRLTSQAGSDYNMLNVAAIPFSVTADATPAGHLTAIPTRQSVVVGDRLGLSMTSNGGVTSTIAYRAATGSGDCGFAPPTHVVGTTIAYSSVGCNTWIPLIQGTVEADADGDGYGDETQDACPADNARQATPCTVDVSVSVRSQRRIRRDNSTKRVKYEVRNGGPSGASNIVLRITKPSFVGSLSATGCTLSSDKRTCAIPSLAASASQFVSISVRAKRGRPGWTKRRNLSLRLLSLDQSDPFTNDNDAVFGLRLWKRRR